MKWIKMLKYTVPGTFSHHDVTKLVVFKFNIEIWLKFYLQKTNLCNICAFVFNIGFCLNVFVKY